MLADTIQINALGELSRMHIRRATIASCCQMHAVQRVPNMPSSVSNVSFVMWYIPLLTSPQTIQKGHGVSCQTVNLLDMA